jgi:hypothetical protein
MPTVGKTTPALNGPELFFISRFEIVRRPGKKHPNFPQIPVPA